MSEDKSGHGGKKKKAEITKGEKGKKKKQNLPAVLHRKPHAPQDEEGIVVVAAVVDEEQHRKQSARLVASQSPRPTTDEANVNYDVHAIDGEEKMMMMMMMKGQRVEEVEVEVEVDARLDEQRMKKEMTLFTTWRQRQRWIA